MTDFASLGSLGHGSEFNFGKYTLELSPSSDVPAGDVVVVWAAWTSHYFFGPNGTQTPELSCTDDAGNRYLQLGGGYPATGDAHEFAGMFISRLRNDLLTTNTITLKHFGPGAKAASLERFSLPSIRRFAFELDELVTGANTGTDPSALTNSHLDPNVEYLLLHVLAAYGQQSDAYTWDSDYTQIVGDGTSGHGNAGGTPPPGDIHVRGGFRIVTGISSDTVDVTSTTTDRDYMQAFAAIRVIDEDGDYPGFPNTPLIDDFNRANEDPANGGIWDTTGVVPQFGTSRFRVVSNKAGRSSSGTGGGSQWTLAGFVTDGSEGEWEEWVTISTMGDVVLLAGNGDGNAATVTAQTVGYRHTLLRAFNAAAVAMGATIFGDSGFTGEIPSGRVGIVWGPNADGTKIGVQQLEVDHTVPVYLSHLWMDLGEGWEWIAATYRTSSAAWIASGDWGIAFEGDGATRLDDFGAGPLDRSFPQFLRRPWEYQGGPLELP
jgi:hypothetical protein